MRTSISEQIMLLGKRQLWCAFYRWEFIRRSEFYRRDTSRFFELFSDWLRAHHVEIEKLAQYGPRDWAIEVEPKLLSHIESREVYHNKIGPFLIALQMKWGTHFPINANYRFDPAKCNIGIDMPPVSLVLDEVIDLKTGLDDLVSIATDRMKQVVERRAQKFTMHPTESRFGVVLHFPNFISPEQIDLTVTQQQWNNLKELLDRVPEIWKALELSRLLDMSPEDERLVFEIIKHVVGSLDRQKQEIILWPVDRAVGQATHYSEFNLLMKRFDWPANKKSKLTALLDQRSPEKKIHLEKLKEYLDIWDRKQQLPRPTNAAIAQELFPNDYNDAQAGAISARVQRGYKKAQAFIDGAFRQIK
jgi:hypothetical protein